MTLVPVYFPPISFFKSIVNQKRILICDNTNYQKQTYRNRCIINMSGGRQNLVVPIKRSSLNKSYENTIIYNKVNWQKNHWRSIKTAYKSSPFFEYYQDDLSFIFFKKQKFLFNLNYEILIKFLDLLELSIEIHKINHINDFQKLNEVLNPKKKIKKFKSYTQVFQDRNKFQSDLSILDLLFNLGPESSDYLRSL
ncbi:MAG: hypothetical protein CMC21_04685 [Flavobacteriaceae bacterium]|nr:hypothetical protein [Flavobacteriaceae bacterium]